MKMNVTMYVSKDFKELIGQDNKYEDHVLNIINQSNHFFEGEYEKISEQDKGQSDFINKKTGKTYDAKIVLSQDQCKSISIGTNIQDFFVGTSKQNNEIYDSIVKNSNNPIEIADLINKQLLKPTTKNKNLIFFFTFPVGHEFSDSISNFIVSTYLDIIFSKISPNINGREIYGICPTLDGHYEIKAASKSDFEFINYKGLDKYFCWTIKL